MQYTVRELPKDHIFPEAPLILRTLFGARSIHTKEDADAFLNPDYDLHVHDPFLLKDMDKAVDRIIKAIHNREKIVIYSDYDADGIPGGTLLRDFFEKIGHENIDTYIPHRHDEGFGFHADAVDSIAAEGANLIITVDCGITDWQAALRAKERSVDVIITDHHEPSEIIPDVYAILNPKQKECLYPEKILCGAGVAFKLVQGILAKDRFGLKEGHEKWFLDLVGVATISDMVPLVGENRVFAHFGLKVLRKSQRIGFQELWKKLRINQRFVNEDDIGFSFSPRINAASRMGHPLDAVRLLRAKNIEEAHSAIEHLEKLNNERKGIVAGMVKEAKKHIKEREKNNNLRSVVVLGNPDWKPSLLGLVANSLVEEVKRPVFLWGEGGGSLLKGSCRSYADINLIDLMNGASGAFVQYGGHSFAGGFEIAKNSVHTVEDLLHEVLQKSATIQEEKIYHVDMELDIEQISWSLFDQMQSFAPFGTGNPKPLFAFPAVVIKETKQFGGDKNHLEVVIQSLSGKTMKAIQFFSHPDSFERPVKVGETRVVIGTLEKSTFGRGAPELRIRITDII